MQHLPAPLCSYAFGTTLAAPFSQVVEALQQALGSRGFHVTAISDIQTYAAAIGETIPPYLAINLCHPQHAARACAAEPTAGVLLSCTIIVYVDPPHGTVVMARDPGRSMDLLRHPVAIEAAMLIRMDLERVIDEL